MSVTYVKFSTPEKFGFFYKCLADDPVPSATFSMEDSPFSFRFVYSDNLIRVLHDKHRVCRLLVHIYNSLGFSVKCVCYRLRNRNFDALLPLWSYK